MLRASKRKRCSSWPNSKSRRTRLIRQIRTHGPWLAVAALAGLTVGAPTAAAQTTPPAAAPAAAAAGPKALTVELNKLEPQGGGCRAYVVVQNDDDTAYQAFKLD